MHHITPLVLSSTAPFSQHRQRRRAGTSANPRLHHLCTLSHLRIVSISVRVFEAAVDGRISRSTTSTAVVNGFAMSNVLEASAGEGYGAFAGAAVIGSLIKR